MKKAIWSLTAILFYFVSNIEVSKADVPIGYLWSKNAVDIYVSVPPALIFIQDSNGNRTGGNPNLSVDSFGRQGGTLDGLKEIPLSSVEQENIGSDDPNTQGQPESTTGWTAHLLDGGDQTYTINLLGLQTGMSEITVTQFIAPQSLKKRSQSVIDSFVTKGNTTQLQLTINASNGSISNQPILKNGSLLADVQTACQMNLITPLACEFLTKEAQLIQDALDHKRFEEAKSLTWVFLHSLG